MSSPQAASGVPLFSYSVRVRFQSAELASAWVQWMYDEHVEAVLEAGALSCELVQSEDEPLSYEARYLFQDQAAFRHYEREQAPRLRQAGLAKFPVELGVSYQRAHATVLFMHFREPTSG